MAKRLELLAALKDLNLAAYAAARAARESESAYFHFLRDIALRTDDLVDLHVKPDKIATFIPASRLK